MRYLTFIIVLISFSFVKSQAQQTRSYVVVDFVADVRSGCESLDVQFTDTSQIIGFNVTSRTWDFGDGTVSSDINPLHTYSSAGKYTVSLILNNDSNLIKTRRKYITINDLPNVEITYTDKANIPYSPFEIQFKGDTLSYNEQAKYIWGFGDNSTDTNFVAEHMYSAEGNYMVTLKVVDNIGCADSNTVDIQIKNDIKVPNVFTPNGDGINDIFFIKSNGVNTFTFTVYSRYGSMIYKTTAKKILWDGRTSVGIELKAGTYFYTLSSEETIEYEYPQTGVINIFK